ncbi:MAG: DUF4412 domain-containing protein [Chitinophagales bacterium]|nr:DUF4412 domain-containing protein [Chitinophagales bacterium]
MKIFAMVIAALTTLTLTNKPIHAQDAIKEGTVIYAVTADMPEHPEVANMFAGSTSTVSFKPGHIAQVMSIAMSKTQILIDANNNSGVILMDAMGNKAFIKMNEDQLKQRQEDPKNYDVNLTDETKQIAGFNCKNAIIKIKDDTQLEFWYTNDIQTPGSAWKKYSKVDGFPLQYQISRKGIVMTFTATKVNTDPVKDDVFHVSTEGYQEMNFDDFMKMVGGN